MVKITEDLIRKRAEHNEGCVGTLEEVALHQYEIERIENLDKICRHLQILLLQNNIIEKIENVNRLKELNYLNLALNNISKIENLEGCESLKKLDLTANFLDVDEFEESMYNLKKVASMRELYLTGNPVTYWKRYREYCIAIVDQLELLDGKEVLSSEKIMAKQSLEELQIDLLTQIELKRIEKERKNKEREELPVDSQKEEYTKETRRKMVLEMAKEKEDAEKRKNPEAYESKPEPLPMFKPDGDIRQCNEGKYEYKFVEWDDPEYTTMEVKVPKFLDTSLLDVNLNPKWVSIKIKGKLLQVKLNDEIIVEKSSIQRSQTTGVLTIKMPKVAPNFVLKRMIEEEKKKKQDEERLKIEKKKKEAEELERAQFSAPKAKVYKHDCETFDDVPDLE